MLEDAGLVLQLIQRPPASLTCKREKVAMAVCLSWETIYAAAKIVAGLPERGVEVGFLDGHEEMVLK